MCRIFTLVLPSYSVPFIVLTGQLQLHVCKYITENVNPRFSLAIRLNV